MLKMKGCKNCGKPTANADYWGYCPACVAAYNARHPERLKTDHDSESNRRYEEKRGNSRQRGYSSRWTTFSKEFLRKHPTCAICGRPARVTDHKTIPADVMMDAWGSFDYSEENYQALCVRCNTRKGMTEDERARLEYQEMKFKLLQMEKGSEDTLGSL